MARANWYTIAGVALAATGAGPDVTRLYQIATQDTDLNEEKRIQRRLKEAILKTSILCGVPRSLTEALQENQMLEERQRRARKYFDTLWTPAAVQANRDKNFKYQPDLYLLSLEVIYELWISDDTILSPVETQMCNVAALICSGSPQQAMWYARGIMRHGGDIEEVIFAQDLSPEVAEVYGCRTGDVIAVDGIPFDDTTPH